MNPPPSDPLSFLVLFRRNLQRSGLREIDRAIADLNAQLEAPDLTVADHLFLTGRRRELLAARWCVNRLYRPILQAGSSTAVPTPTIVPRPETSLERPSQPPIACANPAIVPTTPSTSESAIASPTTAPNLRGIQAALFDATAAKLQSNLANLTETPLEIDILSADKRRELLAIVLRKLEDILEDLRFSQVTLEQLPDKQSAIMLDLWQASTNDFFGRYTTLPLDSSPAVSSRQPAIEIVEVLLRDAELVQREILSKIPLMTEFVAHLLFQTPLLIDNTTCAVGTIEAMARMEALLQHWMIQVGNAVVQPLLNRFGDVVAIKQSFYDRRLLSTREIERFRNNLSWKYRVSKYIGEPIAIFESRYTLFVLQDLGITNTSIYSPRNLELDELEGIQFVVTLTLETRDAIAPRVRSTLSFVGSGVVYMLTEVLGRGIGLIGRGIIKGIGNALQETRKGMKDEG